jgi:ABC-type antimicrobial peptide transport system permease subunit
MAHFVSERRRELAVRVALGATRPDVLKQVLGETVRLLGAGLVAGAIAAWFLTRLIASLLFDVTATDIPTYLVVTLVLATVALAASYLPARRAARLDPLAVLRE